MNSYDIIAQAVRKFWNETYPQNVIAFFYQKYDFETQWEQCEELIFPNSSSDFETVNFENDFCEGETEVKDLHIVPLENITNFYRKQFFDKGD